RRSSLVPPVSLRKRTGLTDFETEGVDEAAIADERHDAPPQIDDLRLREVLAHLVEELAARLPMVSGEHFGVAHRCLLARAEPRGCLRETLDELGPAELVVVLAHDRLQLGIDGCERQVTDVRHVDLPPQASIPLLTTSRSYRWSQPWDLWGDTARLRLRCPAGPTVAELASAVRG